MKKIYLFVVCILHLSFNFAQPAGWNYINSVSVTENSGTGIANYQLKVTFDSQTLISGGQMNADASDLRFGTTCTNANLNYWIESGINTTTTVAWVKLDTLGPLETRNFFMFYGNPSASPLSSIPSVFMGPYSSTDSVASGAPGGVGNSQRGFRFSPNEDLLVTAFGKMEPTGSTRYITLFDFNSQAILNQLQVAGPAGQYSYGQLSNPFWLVSGTQYLLELYQDVSDGYYYGNSSQIGQHLTYYDMRYCNSCTQNTFPTNTLTNYHYGYPDLWYFTKKNISPAPTYLLTGVPTVDLGPDSAYCHPIVADAGYPGGTYVWNTSETTQSISISTSGTYGVTITTSQNCILTDSINVVIHSSPTVNLGVDSAYCASTTLDAGAGAGYSYFWNDSSTLQTLNVISTGIYSVLITDSNNCSGTDTVSVVINTLPVVSFDFTSDSVCTSYGMIALNGGSPAGGVFSGTGVSAGNFDPATGAGSYVLTYTYTDANGCTNTDTDNLLVSNCLGMETTPFGKVTVFPNPTTGTLNIQMENMSALMTCNVYDMLGKSVLSRTFNQDQVTIQLNVIPGMYVLELTDGNKTLRRQIIVQ